MPAKQPSSLRTWRFGLLALLAAIVLAGNVDGCDPNGPTWPPDPDTLYRAAS